MGFWEKLSRLLQGKPVFVPGKPSLPNMPQAPRPAAQGAKVIPQVCIERVECRAYGGHLDCDAIIRNYSHEPVELDRFELFGRASQLDSHIRAGEEREFRLYSGNSPSTVNADCKLYYKNAAGDYFCSQHHVEFQKAGDGTTTIRRIQFQPPVRDM